MKFKSILTKSLVQILPVVFLSICIVTMVSYINSKSIIKSEVDKKMENQLNAATETINKSLLKHAMVPETLAKAVEASYDTMTENNYISLVKGIVSQDKETYGGAVWFEPFRFKQDIKYFAPYAYRDGDKMVYTKAYSTAQYNYFQYDWYKNGFKTDELSWSDPYYDDVSKITMVTATAPFKDSTGKTFGVATGDMNLSSLQNEINNMKIGATGGAFLINNKGYYIAINDKNKIMKKRIQDESNKSFAEVGKTMLSSQSGVTSYKADDNVYSLYYKSVPDVGWKIGVYITQKEIFSPLQKLLYTAIIVMIIFSLATAFIIFLANRGITNLLKSSVSHLKVISDGDLTQDVSETFRNKQDEIGELARSVSNMQSSIKNLLINIKSQIDNIDKYSYDLSSISKEMSSSSQNVSAAIQDVARGTGGQAEDLVSISDVFKVFSTTIEDVIQSIDHVNKASNNIHVLAGNSNTKMEILVASIKEISGSFKVLSEKITGFIDKIKQIEGITGIINSIADQTNLLALNAAIEAARAGESGRGFAVVADEIRKLAEQSKNSSEDIGGIVSNITENMSGITNTANDMDNKLSSQMTIIQESISSFKEIIHGIEEVIPKLDAINSSASNITKQKNNILEKVEGVSSVAEEVSASSQEISAASEQMTASSEEVSSMVEKLKKMAGNMVECVDKFKL